MANDRLTILVIVGPGVPMCHLNIHGGSGLMGQDLVAKRQIAFSTSFCEAGWKAVSDSVAVAVCSGVAICTLLCYILCLMVAILSTK